MPGPAASPNWRGAHYPGSEEAMQALALHLIPGLNPRRVNLH
jgi:hypothetical protein